MTVATTHACPKQLLAGDSLDLLVAIPGDLIGWTGSARLTGASTMAGTVETVGSDFRITFSGQGSPGTKDLTAGNYQLTVWATNGTDRYTVARFTLQVVADLATGTPALAHAQKMLALVETAIEARIQGNGDGGIEEYEIAGRRVVKLSMADLQKFRTKYAAEVARLQNPDRPYARVKAVFTPAGQMPDMLRRYES